MQLDHFEIPVAELVPEKIVDMARAFVEIVELIRAIHPLRRARKTRQDPSVNQRQVRLLQFRDRWQTIGFIDMPEDESCGIPNFGSEGTVALERIFGPRNVRPRSSHPGQPKSH